jgi:hypothetical protein
MITTKRITLRSLALAIGVATGAMGGKALGGNFDLAWHSMDGGGGSSAGGSFELSGTIGQADAGPASGGMSGGGFELTGGFWVAADSIAIAPDCDGSGIVDLADHSALAACLSGPAAGTPGGCECFDADEDGDVDLRDFGILQVGFGG